MAAPGQEMVLVPVTLLNSLKNRQPNITPLLNPVKDQLFKSIHRLDNTLKDTNLPDDVKSSHINQIEKDLSIYADKVAGGQPPRPPPPQPVHATIPSTTNRGVFSSSFPKTLQSQANNLLDILESKPGKISWDSSNEVSIDGKKLIGSNIVDLVGDVIRKRKTPPPEYSNHFLHALSKMNLPEQFIRNTDRIAKFRTYKRDGLTDHTFPSVNRKRKLIRDVDGSTHTVSSAKRVILNRRKPIKWLSV